MRKRADLLLKMLFWTNRCPLLKIAQKWSAQCEDVKTCWCRANNAVLLFGQTRALFWKELKSGAPSAKMTVRADLGLKTCFAQTRALCWKSLKSNAPSAKMRKRADLRQKKLFWKNWCPLLKIAKSGVPSAKMLKRADLRLKKLFSTNSCTFLKTLRSGVPRVKMTKHADLGLKTLFCTKSCTLLEIAYNWCAQCENDKTCWSRANNAVLLFGQTRALCCKELKSGARSAKMTVPADLGLKTLFWIKLMPFA